MKTNHLDPNPSSACLISFQLALRWSDEQHARMQDLNLRAVIATCLPAKFNATCRSTTPIGNCHLWNCQAVDFCVSWSWSTNFFGIMKKSLITKSITPVTPLLHNCSHESLGISGNHWELWRYTKKRRFPQPWLTPDPQPQVLWSKWPSPHDSPHAMDRCQHHRSIASPMVLTVCQRAFRNGLDID